MKTVPLKLYEFCELPTKAQEYALEKWRETYDDPLMQSHMINLLKEKLEERGIKYDTDSIDVRYSLSHCQGDGFMFEGELKWKKYTVYIKHSGRYYHSNSKTIEMQETANLGFHIENEKDEDAFETLYQEICKEMEELGYNEIEYQESAEHFDELCEMNGWMFEENGTMRNDYNVCEMCTGKGWLHIKNGPATTIERCDDCKKYDTDGIASRIHSKVCACGAVVEKSA